jgi:hypothetical protein
MTRLHHMNRIIITTACAAAAALFLPTEGQAHPRPFAYSYDVLTMPAGGVELEQWATWKHYDSKERFEFRTELEFGITDDDQLSLYLSDWRHTSLDDGADETEWRTAGVSWVHNFSDPTTGLGMGTYAEVLWGPEKFALEGKLLLQKNIGSWTLGYNAIFEAEWEGSDYSERKGVIENTFGAVYQFHPSFGLGVEAVHEVEFADYSDAGEHIVFAGPSAFFRKGRFSSVLAGLWQATSVEGEPDFQLRFIASVDF